MKAWGELVCLELCKAGFMACAAVGKNLGNVCLLCVRLRRGAEWFEREGVISGDGAWEALVNSWEKGNHAACQHGRGPGKVEGPLPSVGCRTYGFHSRGGDHGVDSFHLSYAHVVLRRTLLMRVMKKSLQNWTAA